jgi:Pro-kumamolisin, activation domain
MAKAPKKKLVQSEASKAQQRLEGSERHPAPEARRIGPANPREQITVSIYVRRPPGVPAPADIEYWTRNPPGHRKYLSHKEFLDKHGAVQADLDRVVASCRASGLKIVEQDAARRVVVATGSVSQANGMFGVDLGHYEAPHGRYRGREGYVHLPRELIGVVVHVLGLENRPLRRHSAARRNAPLGTTRSNAVPAGNAGIGNQSASQLYNFPAGGGTNQTIGILEFGGGYIVNPTTKRPTDIDSYLASLGLNPVTVVAVPAGASNSPAGSATNVATNDPDVEVTLDISIAAAAAQSATIAVYFAPNSTDEYANVLSKAIHDSTNNPSVISISWSADESAFGDDARSSFEASLRDAATLGVTVLVSSGDNGSNSDANVNDGKARVNYPTSDPWILACGGTVLSVSTATLTESSWSKSGGGVSVKYGAPSWQDGANVPPSVNDGTTRGRGVPDVAGNAGNGYDIILYGKQSSSLSQTGGPQFNPANPGTVGPVGGTSAVSPLYAALIAIINGNLGERVGYLNPWLYAMAMSPGRTIINDVNDSGTNAATATVGTGASAKTIPVPGYQCGAGWDPITGWGSIDGTQLQNQLQLLLAKTCSFVVRKSSFGLDEVDVTRPSNSVSALFPAAFSIQVDGCLPAELGINSVADLSKPTVIPQITNLPSGVFADFVKPVQATDNALPANIPQRFTYVFNIRFDDDSAFTVAPQTVTIQASITPNDSSGPLTNFTPLLLFEEGDPYFVNSVLNKNNVATNPPWLSADLRVFSIQANDTRFGTTMGGNSDAAPTFISNVIGKLNAGNGTAGGQKFDDLPIDEEKSALHLFPTDSNKNLVFNFAVARVRLFGNSAPANHVRVFFRMFQAQSTATAYVQPTPYPGSGPFRTFSDGVKDGRKVALLGIQGGEYVSIPFYAVKRWDTTTNSMSAQPDDPNVQALTPVPSKEVDAYFGCYLDVNQTDKAILPIQPPAANIDGPFTAADLVSIAQTVVRSPHQCLVAELSFDVSSTDTPLLPDGASCWTSDKIAQRNIAWVDIPNPGADNSRQVPQTFEIRPTDPNTAAGSVVDELVIDWGFTPVGSMASIYLPAVSADAILQLASSMYTHHQLRRVDDNTIQCPVTGLTYIPLPPGVPGGANYAGLLSIEVPATVVKGQVYNVIVTQLSSATIPGQPVIMVARTAVVTGNATATAPISWRQTVGAFQLTIPVKTKDVILRPEEALLSYLRWIQEAIPTSSRWFPVFQRYVGQVAGRVSGLGGDPSRCSPSPKGEGLVPANGSHADGKRHERRMDREITGKVGGLIYDRFGDFEGFLLDTEDGEHSFTCREAEVETLVHRAWVDRIRLTVHVDIEDSKCRPESIVLRSPPSPLQH